MNLSYFISRRIRSGQRDSFSPTVHKIAVASIGLGLAAVIVSFLIMKGFQETVRNKMFSFSGHLIVTRFTMNNSPEEVPMNYRVDVYDHPEKYPTIHHVQEYAHKAGLVKSEDEVLGVFIKGVGKSFNQDAFRSNLVAGKFFDFPDSGYSNGVVLSKLISDKLNAKVGDDIIVHFFQTPPRLRKLKVSGIYETNLSEYFDSKVILGDIRLIQRLNNWSDSLAGGMEIFVKDPNRIDEAGHAVGEMMDYDLNIERVSDRYIQVFEWLNLLSRQVNFLLGIILFVVCLNMVSIILIIVMERTQMIGLLKALGASDGLIRKVFLYNGFGLILKGMVFGNALGLGLCYLQDRFKLVHLSAKDYYMEFVPISWHWDIVWILNLLTLVIVSVVLFLPTMVISRVNPIKAIRFD